MLAFVLACSTLGFLAHAHSAKGPRRKRSIGAALACALAAIVALPPKTMVAKLVGVLAMPTGLLWMLIGIVPFACAARRRWRWGIPTAFVWLGFTLAGNTWLGATWLGALEAPYAELDPFASEYDAVFVLGGGAAAGPSGRAQINHSGDRVVLAAQLYHAGRTPILVSSGSEVPGANAVGDLAAATAELWISLGVPPSAIRQIPGPYDTRSEVQAYADLIREESWQRVGLISSAWHLNRAQMHADIAGIAVSPLPADFRGNPTWEGIVSVPPSGLGFRLVQLAAWETLGRLTRQ